MKAMQTQLNSSNGVQLGFESTLWKIADKMRNNMEAAEYKHVVLGLIFLKSIENDFISVQKELLTSNNINASENPNVYKERHVFWIPEKARWSYIKSKTKETTIGIVINKALTLIEAENSTLSGVLPKVFESPSLDKERLGELIDLIDQEIKFETRQASKDILGRVYEYFLGQFAHLDGKNSGQFYTPRSVVKLLVEMIEPYNGVVYDPCCGSGGMFIQSERFVEAHNGKIGDIFIYGQESNETTRRLCLMNLAIRGIEGNIQYGDSFTNDLQKKLRADFILANPPFNDSDWKGQMLQKDDRWKYGVPPEGNANYAWIQHFIYHLSDNGTAGFVLTNGALKSNNDSEYQIRSSIIDADLVDCIVSLPDRLFYNTPISACLWFIAKNKVDPLFRNRKDETLFINGKNMGLMSSKRHRELSDHEIELISDTYKSWKHKESKYEDIPGFCSCAKKKEIANHDYALVPGRYTGCQPYEIPKLFPGELEKTKSIIESRIRLLKKTEEIFLNGGD